MNYPTISIVTPSYNQGQYLEKTILSVLDQDYPHLEYIIIDGGSTDNSVEIIKKYENHLAYWTSEPDRGQCHAINKGFSHATGEIFAWLNSDDYYAAGALRTVAEMFRTNPTVGAVVGAGEMTDGTYVTVIPSFYVSVDALYGWVDRFFMQPSCFFTKQVWLECGPLEERFNFAMDLDLWIKIAKRFAFATTPAILSTSLAHSSAKTTAFASASIIEAVAVITAHGGTEQSLRLNKQFIEELSAKRKLLTELEGRLAQMDNLLMTRNQELAERDRWLAERDREIEMLGQYINELRGSIEALRNSLSWKVTKPLRWAGEKLSRS